MKNTKQILSIVLLMTVPAAIQASTRDDGHQSLVAESGVRDRMLRDAALSKQKFLMHLGRIAYLAKNDNTVIRQSTGTDAGSRQNKKGQFYFTIRTDMLKSFTVNLASAIAPLIEFGAELKWQIDEECTERLFETFKVIMQPWKNVTVDRLDLRGQWVLQSISGLNRKGKYFTPKAWELWKKLEGELKEIRLRELLGECLRELVKEFRGSYKITNFSEQNCQRCVALLNKAQDYICEMRKVRVENAVTGDEMRDFMDALSWVWIGVGSTHSEEQQKQQRDLLCSTGFRDKVLDFMDAVHYIDEYDMDQDASGRFMLKDFRSGKVVEVNPGEFSQEELVDLKDQTGQFCEAEGAVLTEDLYWWCTKGTGGVHQVFMSPWVQQMKEEMICWKE